MENILEVRNLKVDFRQRKTDHISIIRDISFHLGKGECLGILGESGSGKSMTMKAVLGLLNKNFLISGSAEYKGYNLLKQTEEKIRHHRGKEITMILQNPMTCFDPLYRIENQISESWLSHYKMSKEEIRSKALQMLKDMQIRNGEEVLKKYPHQLSGGMLQRIMIGIALSMDPEILVADEPTTALDAVTQFEILKEFQKIKQTKKTSILFISHDLSVISQIADRIVIMNEGRITEQGDFDYIIKKAGDENTRRLVESRFMVMKQFHKMIRGDLI